MIITCPSCGARYKVRDDLIPESGKRVKCKKCSALFRAFPGKKAILEKAAPKPEKPAAPVSSQATVMVDQTKLSNFLQQNVDSPSAASSPEQPEPSPAPAPAAPNKPSHATVQIDRTKIDAFLQHKVDNAGGDYEPNTTLEVSREELDTFLTKPGAEQKVAEATQAIASAAKAAEASEPAHEEPAPSYDPKVDPDKYADLQRAVGVDVPDPAANKLTVEMPPQIELSKQDRPVFEDVHQNIASKAGSAADIASDLAAASDQLDLTVPDRFDLPKEQETTPSFDDPSDDLLWNQSKESPSFPSDEELGLVAEPEGDLASDSEAADVSFDAEDDFLSSGTAPADDDFLSSGESAIGDDDFLGSDNAMTDDDDFLSAGSDAPSSDIFSDDASEAASGAMSAADPSFDDPAPEAAPVALFTVMVENTEYPNKSLDALDRWINEGRLLETDMVAPAGSDQFQKAFDIPEIAAIFNRYFGQNTPAVEPEPAKKKGFFGKLFSIFGKK